VPEHQQRVSLKKEWECERGRERGECERIEDQQEKNLVYNRFCLQEKIWTIPRSL
jgi:hypothetical protein